MWYFIKMNDKMKWKFYDFVLLEMEYNLVVGWFYQVYVYNVVCYNEI